MLCSSVASAIRYPQCSALRTVASTGCPRVLFSTASRKPSIDYRWINGVERLELYVPGGYHPVMIDDLLHNRYRIVDKLGFGGHSTIWLARDEVIQCYVTVKAGISSLSCPRRAPDILRALTRSRTSSKAPHASPDAKMCAALPNILDAFDVRGPNGTHPCYTLTPAEGSLKEAYFSDLFSVQVARALASKLTIAVAFVHSQGFVHGGRSRYIPN